MIPFMSEFETGKHVKLGSIWAGQHAIILSMHFPRALLVLVTAHEKDGTKDWTHGYVTAPAPFGDTPETFSRDTSALAVAVTDEEVLALIQKYPDVSVCRKTLPATKEVTP